MIIIDKALSWLRDNLRQPVIAPELSYHPDGEGALVVIQASEGSYELKTLPGPTESVPGHVFANYLDLVAYLVHREELGRVSPGEAIVTVGQHSIIANFDDQGLREPIGVSACLPVHPFLSPWLARRGKMNPHEALTFLRQLPGELVGTLPGSDTPAELGEYLVAQLLRINVNVGGKTEFEFSRHGLVKVARRGEERTVTAELPDRFRFKSPVFEGVETEETVDVLVHLSEAEGIPYISFEVARSDHLLREGRRSLAIEMGELLGEGWCVTVGEASLGRRAAGFPDALLSPSPTVTPGDSAQD